ncbi:two-partner secretion domain-containing protein [Limnohabitans parvus]|uniref:Filamentous haemagglutinin FhaB/tRNA nuclease CdiA-like TPS domain-containing protein n=1 Tax=Limnohabitans parvus II-B4 TaxID=1293052 RepID=A0A315EBC8_9BURK|nr:filamentous hemagglutinin N-terminal domain-containing protein [Limnohabitans parvus]PUE55266.1 hypothetical protein B9Z37_01425 [Limnohabitans parvus II-B4]
MNARSYKTVFSKRLGTLVAVGEHASSQGKANGAGSGGGAGGAGASATLGYIAALTASFAFVSLAWAAPATNALPTSGTVVQGAASMSQTANQLNITQSTQRAAINWQSFDIGSQARVQVYQPNAQSVLLNRVVGATPSQIFGQMQANGHVILVNPNGVLFGKDGSVNAGGFTASTLNISDANFMAGNMVYERNGSTAGIVNQGNITTAPGGYVALLGAAVSNEGSIHTQGGSVVMGAGETIKVPVSGTGRIKLELTPAAINASVSNSGSIVTEGGQVYMQALALNRAAAQILQSGSIDTTGEKGGDVNVLADGGQIRVNGSITANSNNGTAGGDIYIGRDKDTNVLAAVGNVSGATLESRGGFVETSGDWLGTKGVTVLANEWLLDPSDITISNATSSNVTGTNPADIVPTGGAGTSSVVNVGTIQTAINGGTSVTIKTTNSSNDTGTGAGNITIADELNLVNNSTENATLKLIADNGIFVNKKITGSTGTSSSGTTPTGLVNIDMLAKGNFKGSNTDSPSSKGITLNSTIVTNGTVTLDGTSRNTSNVVTGVIPSTAWSSENNTNSGVVFNTGSGITADHFQVKGTHLVNNSFGTNGVYINGVVKFNATGNTDSNITGNSNAQGNFGAGVMVFKNATLDITQNGSGTTTIKGSNSNAAGGNGIRIGGLDNPTINTKGKVTIGQQADGVNSPLFIRGTINAGKNSSGQGVLNLIGQTTGTSNNAGVLFFHNSQVISGTTSTANDAVDININGKSINGVGVRIGPTDSSFSPINIKSEQAANISITGTSTNEDGINNRGSNISTKGDLTVVGSTRGNNKNGIFYGSGYSHGGNGGRTWTANNLTLTGTADTAGGIRASGIRMVHSGADGKFIAAGDIKITGTVNGQGSGNGVVVGSSDWGTHAVVLDGKNITVRGNVRTTSADTSNAVYLDGLQAKAAGNITLQGETLSASATTINVTGNPYHFSALGYVGNATSLQAGDNLLIQANQGSIAFNEGTRGAAAPTSPNPQTSTSKLTGKNIIIDNSGAGMAIGEGTAVTGSGGTEGATLGNGLGKATTERGISLADSRAITAIENLNINGTTSASNKEGIFISSNTIEAKNIKLVGSSTGAGGAEQNAKGVRSFGTLKASDSITLEGTSTNVTGVGIEGGSVTAGGAVVIKATTTVGQFQGANIGGAVQGASVSITGNSSNNQGVMVSSAVTATNGGVDITGTTTSAATSMHGVLVNANIKATNGDVTINGTSDNGYGVHINGGTVTSAGETPATGGSTPIAAHASAININGVSNGKNPNNASVGAQIQNTVIAAGKLTIKGETKGVGNYQAVNIARAVSGETVEIKGDSVKHIGVEINAAVTATNGDITVTAGNTVGTHHAFKMTANGTLKTDVDAKTININTNGLDLQGAVQAGSTGSGTVNIKTTGNNAIDIGGSDDLNSTAAFQKLGINKAELDKITAGKVVIGDTSKTGDITVSQATITKAVTGDITLQTKGTIAVNKALTVGDAAGTKNLTLDAGGAITSDANGKLTANNLTVKAGSTIGAEGAAIKTKVVEASLTSGGAQFLGEDDAIRVAAKSNSGDINITTTNGTMRVETVNGVVGIDAGTGNVKLKATSDLSHGIEMPFNVKGKDITVDATANNGTGLGFYGAGGSFNASGSLNLTGTATGTGNGLYTFGGEFKAGTGINITGTSAYGQGVGFDANAKLINTSGDIVIKGTANGANTQGIGIRGVSIINGENNVGGRITLEAAKGDIFVSDVKPTVSPWNLVAPLTNTITQNGTGDVKLTTVGSGQITVPLIVNNGAGNVIVAAGSDLAAGNGGGGQVKTVAGNTITQNRDGNTYIYSGSAPDTGNLADLNNGFSTLRLTPVLASAQNAQLGTSYQTGATNNTISGGDKTQVMFRSTAKPQFDVNLSAITITKPQGSVDPDQSAINAALIAGYTAANPSGGIKQNGTGPNLFTVGAAAVIGSFSQSTRAPGDSAGSYQYTGFTSSGGNSWTVGAINMPTLKILPSTVNPIGPVVLPVNNNTGANSRVRTVSGFGNSGAATGVLDDTPVTESREVCSDVFPENCECQPSVIPSIEICFAPKRVAATKEEK